MPALLRRMFAGLAILASVAATVVTGVGTGAAASTGLRAFGLSIDGRYLVNFNTATPQVLDWVMLVGGQFGPDTHYVGLDFRVQDGKLYLIGNLGNIYSFESSGPGGSSLAKVSQTTVRLTDANFGVDFNPATDRLRVVSDVGMNLRHSITGHFTVTDLALSAPGVSAVAQTNNDLNPTTSTALFGVNTVTDQLVLHNPPNNGVLVPVGPLCVNVGPNAGLDIYSELSNGTAISNTAFGTFRTPAGTTGLYSVDLGTGSCSAIGTFPNVFPVTDIAVALDQNSPRR